MRAPPARPAARPAASDDEDSSKSSGSESDDSPGDRGRGAGRSAGRGAGGAGSKNPFSPSAAQPPTNPLRAAREKEMQAIKDSLKHLQPGGNRKSVAKANPAAMARANEAKQRRTQL